MLSLFSAFGGTIKILIMKIHLFPSSFHLVRVIFRTKYCEHWRKVQNEQGGKRELFPF